MTCTTPCPQAIYKSLAMEQKKHAGQINVREADADEAAL
jgi:hypothetical protein